LSSKQNRVAFQVGCTYIGTVVGAGFASGREIYQFFGRYGNIGYVTILMATIFFAVIGYRMLLIGHQLQAKSYRELNAFLFGRHFGSLMDTLFLVMLFGVTVAMLAGAGELFSERLNLHFQIGVLVTIIVTFLTTLRGMSALLKINTVIVPILVSFVLYAAFHAAWTHGMGNAWATGQAVPKNGWQVVQAIVAAVIYSALNIGLSAGVLVPLGAKMSDVKVLSRGAALGAAGLGAMLLAVMFTLFTYAPTALTFSVPMGYVAVQLGTFVQWGFIFVLWGEIYSTLVGNVYAMVTQVVGRSERVVVMYTAGILAAAFLCSQIGFNNLVAYGYTAFGWVSLLLLLALCKPR